MDRDQDNSWCGGSGGGIKGANYAMSLESGKDKIQDVLETGAKRIISGCLSCKVSINDASKALGADLKAIDITELVAEALNL